jgi:hypothetical protein
MEMSQGNSLCSYLKQIQKVIFLSSTESENRKVEQVLPGGFGTSGGWGSRGEDVRKGCVSVNTVQILSTHAYKWKK